MNCPKVSRTQSTLRGLLRSMSVSAPVTVCSRFTRLHISRQIRTLHIVPWRSLHNCSWPLVSTGHYANERPQSPSSTFGHLPSPTHHLCPPGSYRFNHSPRAQIFIAREFSKRTGIWEGQDLFSKFKCLKGV